MQTASNAGGAVLANTHGDTAATLDSSGISGMAAYAPGGKTLTSAGILADLGFQGDWTDPAASSVRTASRWYSTATGSFTSADSQTNDPLPAVHANPYAYGDADPLNNSDTSGHDACRAYQDRVVAQQRREAAERAAQARQLQAWAAQAARARAEYAAERAASIAYGLADQARRLAGLSNVLDEIARDNARSAAAARRQARALKQWYRNHPSHGYAGGRVGAFAFLGEVYSDAAHAGPYIGRALAGRNIYGRIVGAIADVGLRWGAEAVFASSGGCLSEKPQEDGEADSGEKDAPRGAPNRRDDNDPLYDEAGEGPTREENPQTVEGSKPGEAEEDPLGSGNTDTGGTREEETPPAVDENPAEPETEPGSENGENVCHNTSVLQRAVTGARDALVNNPDLARRFLSQGEYDATVARPFLTRLSFGKIVERMAGADPSVRAILNPLGGAGFGDFNDSLGRQYEVTTNNENTIKQHLARPYVSEDRLATYEPPPDEYRIDGQGC